MATQTPERIELERGSDGNYRQRRKRSATVWVLLGFGWLIWAVLVRVPRWLIRRVARNGWRNRWHLAPLAGGVWVVTYGRAVPVITLAVLALVAVPAVILAMSGEKVGSRMWLSAIERASLAEGCIGAGLWTAGEWGAAAAGLHLPAALDHWITYGLYVALTGHAAYRWWWSRRPAWSRRMSPAAKLYLGQWAAVAATGGGFASSYVRRDTCEGLRRDDVTFRVRLGEDHHSEDIGEAERRTVERLIKGPKGADLQPGSVTITHPTDTVNEVQVAISPSRAIESTPVEYVGLQPISEDGRIPAGREPSGRQLSVGSFDDSGKQFLTVIGGANAGKTSTLAGLVLPGPATYNDRGQPIETVWAIDGGRGTSAPELAHAFDIHATQPWMFPIVFEAWHAVHLSREDRRGRAGLSSWSTWQEDDPILTLLMLETPGITRHLTPTHDRMFAEALMRIRKLGMGVTLETQDMARGNIPGGQSIEVVRKQLFANGTVLPHRDGSNDQRAVAGSHDAQQLVRGMNSLPPGGGWHLVIEQGRLLSPKARSPWLSKEDRRAAADAITPRPLAGADLEAAMRVPGFAELYEHRHDPTWTPSDSESADDAPDEAVMHGDRPFVPVQPARDLADARVLRAIREHLAAGRGPLGKSAADQHYGIPAATWELGRKQLLTEGKIHQPTPGKWAPGPSPEGARS